MWKRWFRAKTASPPTITVVSGLPRSGTSMMMRMLEAGGMAVMTDNIRKADDDNPHGYYEAEHVKKLRDNASFLDQAHGKAIKIISLLLYELPRDKHYHIIFMRRDMQEILASQKTMLRRRNRSGTVPDEEMKTVFEKHLDEISSWINHQPNMDRLYMDYHDVIKQPLESARRVNVFLGHRLGTRRMAEAVDKRLYRKKADPG